MSSRYDAVAGKLACLQEELQAQVDLMRHLTVLQKQACQSESGWSVFMKRRLQERLDEAARKFERLIAVFRFLLATELARPLFLITQAQDIGHIRRISRMVAYIHHAFVGEPDVGNTLLRLKSLLPAR